MEAVKAKFPTGLGAVDTLFVSRGAKLTYTVETREDRVPRDAVVALVIYVSAIRATIDREAAKLR